LLTCQLYGASLEPRPAASLRTGLFFIVLRGITSLISDSQSERLDEYPEVKAKLTAQLRENHEQLKRLSNAWKAAGKALSNAASGPSAENPSDCKRGFRRRVALSAEHAQYELGTNVSRGH
jgi:hypothetical protein